MKILAIHNFHRTGSSSGDDQVFNNETALLEEHGHNVVRYTVSNDSFDQANIAGKVSATIGMLWSSENYRAIDRLIKLENPDIVHVHTFFPLLSPSVLYAAKRNGCKVVATLHDTRFVCPIATSLRDNKICNACGDGHYLRMVHYKCFKGSWLKSFYVGGVFKYHRMRRSFYEQIDRYICLNNNQIKLLVDIGFDPGKIEKKYNFIPDEQANVKAEVPEELPKRYVVYYGRIGVEKGIRILQRIWNEIQDIPLVIMGSGPLETSVETWAKQHSNIFFLGYTEHARCLSIVKGSEFVIFPSIWYEGCSMVEIEAESLGKPLVATDLGFSTEAIENGINGLKVPVNDIKGFVHAIRSLWNDPETCVREGLEARNEYESKYRPETSYLRLMNIYDGVLEEN